MHFIDLLAGARREFGVWKIPVSDCAENRLRLCPSYKQLNNLFLMKNERRFCISKNSSVRFLKTMGVSSRFEFVF